MANAEVQTISNCKKGLKITVPVEKINEIRENQIKVVRKEANVPGFRKGKVPKNVLLKYYGDTVERYTLDEAIQSGYEAAMEETKIFPIAAPSVTKIDYDDDKNLKLEMEVEVYPEIELKKYKGIELSKTIYKIEDSDIDAELDNLRQRFSTLTPVEEPAAEGHRVTVDMQEIAEDGSPLIGKKYPDITFDLGSGKFDADLEKQLTGIKAGEERRIEKTMEDKSKTERYMVTAQKIEKVELPDLDDEFVKDLDSGVETVTELRERMRQNMEQYWGQESEHAFFHEMADKLLAENPFDVPQSMVENYLDRMIEEMRKKQERFEEAKVRENYREEATFNIKWFQLKHRIAEEEKIEVSDDDIKEFIEKIEDEKVRDFYSQNEQMTQRIRDDLAEKKILDFLTEVSKVKENEVTISKRKDLVEA